MKPILVVGGAGYVGSHLVKLLLGNGREVHVLDNLSSGHADAVGAAHLVQADLLDPTALRKVFLGASYEAVMHFAALCYVGESVDKPREYYRNNLVGTLNLVDAMLDADVRKLVFSSTCATYGNPIEIPMRESHPQQPINPYGASKLAVEWILRDYAAAYRLSAVSLRYFNAAGCDPEGRIGERHNPETHLIPLVLIEALRVKQGGDPARTTLVVNGDGHATPDGTCVRDYVHVDDLASAHLAALCKLDQGFQGFTAYNLGTGTGFSVLEVIESARRVTGVPIRHTVGAARPGDPPQLVADNRAAVEGLDWSPRFRSLDDIVQTAWRWFDSRS